MIFFRFLFSLLCALLLTILPFPYVLGWFMPDWCLLVLFAWYFVNTDFVPIWLAWLLGLVLDGLTGSLLGLHALGYVLTWYIFSLFSVRIVMFPMFQKMLIMGLIALADFAIILCVQALFSDMDISWHRLYAVFFSAICWPGVLAIVNKLAFRPSRKAWGNW